jgi:hypothetical protein
MSPMPTIRTTPRHILFTTETYTPISTITTCSLDRHLVNHFSEFSFNNCTCNFYMPELYRGELSLKS